jgi:hypothetical protein
MPPIPLEDGLFLFSSGLRDFDESTLLCTFKGLKVHALYLDMTDVDPSHSDPMVRIFSPPRHTPFDAWMYIEWSRSLPVTNLMVFVSPPPDILHSLGLGEIL